MEKIIPAVSKKIHTRPLRALIEIDGGELKIYPIAQSDADERQILDALRFAVENWRQ